MILAVIHFEPTGHTLRHNIDLADAAGTKDVHKQYREALERGVGGHENDHDGLPPYIIPNSPEDSHWRSQHPEGFGGNKKKNQSFTTGSTPAHVAAQEGDTRVLAEAIRKNKDIVNAKDSNGWTPLHESARGGHLEAVKLLVENGADVHAKTYGAGTALWWAKQSHDADHPVIQFLESLGAPDAGPEL